LLLERQRQTGSSRWLAHWKFLGDDDDDCCAHATSSALPLFTADNWRFSSGSIYSIGYKLTLNSETELCLMGFIERF
jgi:hypothetical protein